MLSQCGLDDVAQARAAFGGPALGGAKQHGVDVDGRAHGQKHIAIDIFMTLATSTGRGAATGTAQAAGCATRPAPVVRPAARRIDRDPNVAALDYQIGPKSVITFPSGDQRLPGRGFYEISGLAWSGGGAIRKVEVSTDGGKR